ncbi:MAG: hypothetical protein DI536_27890 [Archangium gephyra]|uniref:Uncharacterized protein n=1 Tax=Archangium gephyra TaxID=48 RepID=A0A2W5UEG1_9BACT|nr:MAG: hypothetical protein DI536_27890 [Archangium gephyra]
MRYCGVLLLFLSACDSTMNGPDGGGSSAATLQPGSAGTGHLAYLVETQSGRELEVVNLTTAKVEYRSAEDDGEVSQFFLSADGTTAAFRTATRRCVRVALPSGTTSDCAPAGLMLIYLSGISNDGARVSFTAARADTFQPTRVIAEGGQVTFLAEPPDTDSSQVTGGGGISPDGEYLYEFRIPKNNGGLNPPLSLLKYPRSGGAPSVVFDGSAGVLASSITDVTLQQNEAGTRGLFTCFDGSRMVPAERLSTCAVDLQTGAVTRVPNAVGSLSLDGSRLVTVPPFGEGYRVYEFGSTTPLNTVTRPGGAVALSPDGARLAFRMREDDAFYVAATMPVSGGAAVRVQRDDSMTRAEPEYLLWKR